MSNYIEIDLNPWGEKNLEDLVLWKEIRDKNEELFNRDGKPKFPNKWDQTELSVYQSLNRKFDFIRDEVELREEMIKNQIQKIHDLKQENAELKKQVAELEKENKSFLAENADLQLSVTNLEKANSKLKKRKIRHFKTTGGK